MRTQAIALLAVAACSGNGGYHPPSASPEIEGFVTERNAEAPTSVLVEESPELEQGDRKIWFRINDETQLLRWNDDAGGYGTVDPMDLAEGLRVRVWSIGPIAESYPEQGTAHTIVLLE